MAGMVALSLLVVLVMGLGVAPAPAVRHRLVDMGGDEATDGWDEAHATFYGGYHGEETMEGACGYGNLFKQGYGLQTTALSTALFNDGAACGACFQIVCHSSKWCIPGAGAIKITATNFCPPNYTKTVDIWCNPPQKHFDLTLPMFLKIARYRAGVVPVKFRRVMCSKRGGVRFEISGNRYFMLVLVYNVGGAGDVRKVWVRVSNCGGWVTMRRNWGQKWQADLNLVGRGLSFRVATSDGKRIEFDNVVPANWQFGQTYDGKKNFFQTHVEET